jgi:hypothetical protein
MVRPPPLANPALSISIQNADYATSTRIPAAGTIV